MMAYPSCETLKDVISGSAITGIPQHLTSFSFTHGHRIFGSSLADVREKSTMWKVEQVRESEGVVSRSIVERLSESC